MKIKYSTIAMSRNKYSSFRTAERVWKTLFKANVTVLLLVLINNVNISRLNRIGRQLQPVELAAGELAVNWPTTSAWLWFNCMFTVITGSCFILFRRMLTIITPQINSTSHHFGDYRRQGPSNTRNRLGDIKRDLKKTNMKLCFILPLFLLLLCATGESNFYLTDASLLRKFHIWNIRNRSLSKNV